MALEKDIVIQKDNFQGSLIAKQAYFKINKVEGDKNLIRIFVSSFVKSPAGDLQFFDSASYEFVPDMNGENFVKQGYVYLKSLAEFSGAMDC